MARIAAFIKRPALLNERLICTALPSTLKGDYDEKKS